MRLEEERTSRASGCATVLGYAVIMAAVIGAGLPPVMGLALSVCLFVATSR